MAAQSYSGARVLAAGAHPDDIEFMMAGTMLLLGDAGALLHMWSLANGCCGTRTLGREQTIRLREEEARASAREAGATWHPPLTDDMAIFFNRELLARTSAVVREVRPDVMLVPSPYDYMEDHVNASRLLVTAAFARGMPNLVTEPPVEPYDSAVFVYHAMPHGLRDGLGRLSRPGLYVDVGGVLEKKRAMLAMHRSQSEWLEESQGMVSSLQAMESMCREVGEMSGRFEFAEGWTRHNPLGLGPREVDPLVELLGENCIADRDFEGSRG